MNNLYADVIVVGAGPSGSVAALCLARAGLRVALLDKTNGSFEKACGGGLLRGSLGQLRRLGVLDQIVTNGTSAPSGARISSPDGSITSQAFPKAQADESGFLRIVRRSQLDHALLEAACSAGAAFHPSTRALGMTADVAQATVYADRSGDNLSLTAPLVIAADGASGSFSRNLGIWSGSRTFNAARAYVCAEDMLPSLIDFHFFTECLPFYLWVFPLESGLCNVGLAAPAQRNTHLVELLVSDLQHKAHLQERLRHAEIVGSVRGGVLRIGFHPRMVTRDRLLVAGDAACLTNPLTGEGIKQAVVSGELAARCALCALKAGRFTRQDLAPYRDRLYNAFFKRTRQLSLLGSVISTPRVMNRLVRCLSSDRGVQILLDRALIEPNTWNLHKLGELLARLAFSR